MSLLPSAETEPLNINSILKTSVSNLKVSSTIQSSLSEMGALDYELNEFEINQNLVDSLMGLKERNQIELSSILVAAVNIILQRYSGQECVLYKQAFLKIGHNRIDDPNDFKIAEIVTEFNGADFFRDVLNGINTKIVTTAGFNALNNKEVQGNLPDALLIDEPFKFLFISEKRNDADLLETTKNNSQHIGRLFTQINNLHLSLCITETESNIQVRLFSNKSQLSEVLLSLFNKSLINLLEAICDDDNCQLGAYDILDQSDLDMLINVFNDTVTFYPKEKTLFELFEQQVAKSPGACALIQGEKQLTYDELNRQANRLAWYLIKEGVKPGDNVGILTNRNFYMIIGMLGILKAGGAYVPIDPDYPLERQEYIFNQSLIKVVVADDRYPLKSIITDDNFKLINKETLAGFDDTNPSLKIDSKQLAYTIYTSGSTGRPKGVMIEHHSAVNLILWVNNKFNIGHDDRLLFITSMCFDLSVYDIFGMLASGGALVIAEKEEIQNVQTLSAMMVKHQITFWDSVPTTLDYLVTTLEMDKTEYRYEGLKTVFMSGDWIPVNLPDRIKVFFPKTQVVSLGGATEATVWSNYLIVEKTDELWSSIPYGKPIANNFFYILNERLQPVPVGTIGDLYIGGVGVARGYANDIEKTRYSFIPDPFHANSGGMMYRTGDLGRMMPDYNMEFIGRKDNQVKIQGFRVELGEIESVLNNSVLVSNAVVLAKKDKEGTKRLVGYIVTAGPELDQELLILYVKKTLPDYMVPSVWIKLDRLPLTSNGKIDRNSLPDIIHFESPDEVAVEAETETEKLLINIWREYFKKTDIKASSNFFEIGGHSLMAVQILSRLKKISGKNFQISILYKFPTIKLLAEFIDKEVSDYNFKSLVPIKPSGSYPPLYIIHGDGLNVLNFSELAKHVSPEQPVYGLQALGLNGKDEPIDNLLVIAYHYMQEIIQHNPEGPYLLAGYSSGGYVAMEIRKQMIAMKKEVKMLIIFDTDAEKTEYKDWYSLLPKKAKRHFPRIIQALKFSLNQLLKGKNVADTIHNEQKRDTKDFYKLVQKIKSKHITAFRNYHLEPFDGKIYLYKAKISVHYVEYGKFLGWEKYANKGVELFEIPGDHFSMLQPPYVTNFGTVLQNNIDDLAAS